MKLLIFTQKVDSNDPVLGFFHHWIQELSKQFEFVIVVCLEEGTHTLPSNVKVRSLGKESGASKWKYIKNFYKYIWRERDNYSAVFVHMNQEYVLMGGLFWYLWGKKVYMWRNHHSGSYLTDLAAKFCTKVFCTSKFSYTAKYKKTVLMPVGVDVHVFKKLPEISKTRNILFLARISPVKKPHVLLHALALLKKKNITATASFYGDPLPKDQHYYESLKELANNSGLQNAVTFEKGIPNTETVKVYNMHDIFVNLSSSGMYDKTIFEAMACESLSLASNENLIGEIDSGFIFKESDAQDLADKLEKLLSFSAQQKAEKSRDLREYVVQKHSLDSLVQKLKAQLL